MLRRKRKMEQEKPKPKEWVSAKIPKDVHEKLKEGGKGIGEALEIMVKSQEEAFEKKLGSIEELGTELADTLLQYGIPEIRFAGADITDVTEEGTQVVILGKLRIEIGDADARKSVIEVLKPKPIEKGGEQNEHVETGH